MLDEVHRYEDWSTEIKTYTTIFHKSPYWLPPPPRSTLARAWEISVAEPLSTTCVGCHSESIFLLSTVWICPSLHLMKSLKPWRHLRQLVQVAKSGEKFQNYLVTGVYPYYRTTGKAYHQQILNTVSRVTDIDLPAIFNIDYSTTRQVKNYWLLWLVLHHLRPTFQNWRATSR